MFLVRADYHAGLTCVRWIVSEILEEDSDQCDTSLLLFFVPRFVRLSLVR
jgi:hypothetical protein